MEIRKTDMAVTITIVDRVVGNATLGFDDNGVLSIISDWGIYSFQWVFFGDDFGKFIAESEVEYLYEHLENNYWRNSGRSIPKSAAERLRLCLKLLIEEVDKHRLSEG